MKKKLTVVLVCLLSVLMAFAFAACGDSIKLSETTLSLTVGDTKELKLLDGETDVSKDAAWSTSDSKVANVTSRGSVSAQGAGSATITAKYNNKDYTCAVTVTAKATVVIEITDEAGKKIDSLSVERDTTATVKATTSDGSDVTWSVSDANYATVTPVDGQKNTATVKGLFPTTNATVYASSGSARASISLTVTNPAGNETWYDLAAKNADGTMIDNGSTGQNKVEQGKWAYWCDMSGWNGGSVDISYAEYVGDTEGSEAGTVHFKYSATAFGNYPDSCVQLTFRNLYDAAARPNGLRTGEYYHLTCKITSDAAGTINLNGTNVTLAVGDNNVEAYFQHNDTERVYGPTEYDNIYYTAVFITTGQGLPAAELTLTDFKWETFTPTILSAPTVTMSGDKATVADTANDAASVDGYEIGFFDGSNALKYTVKAVKGENTINSASWDNGTYTVKARALPANGKYSVSLWSESNDVTYTVEHAALVYDLMFAGADNVNITSDGWYYWNELGEMTEDDAHGIVEAKYDDGTVTYEFSATQGNWYSHQLFFNYTSLAAGSYTVTFKFTSSVEGTIRINDTYYDFTANETKEITSSKGPGIMISVQFGRATDDFSGTTTAIEAGRFTITDIDIAGGGGTPKPDAPAVGTEYTPDNAKGLAKSDETSAELGQWSYWYVESPDWYCGEVVNMSVAELKDGKITLTYTGGSMWFAVQLFYKNANMPATYSYRLTAKIEVSKACSITLNDQVLQLNQGVNNIDITFVNGNVTKGDANSISAFDMQMGVNSGGDGTLYTDITVSVSDVKWTAVESTQTQPTPTAPANPADYELESKVEPTYALQNADKDAFIGEGDTAANKFAVWHTAQDGWEGCGTIVTMNETKIEGNALTISYTGGSVGFSVQLFYNNPSVVDGKQYFLSMKINASAFYTITINGKEYTLAAGDNNVALVFTKVSDMQALDVQFPGNATQLTFVISDIAWQEIKSAQPEIPAGGKEINVTPTEWYGATFVKISMSTEDFNLVKEAHHVLVNGGPQQVHGDGKGFLVDGDILQVQLPESYESGKTYTAVWYDADGNVIARATFTCTQA